MDGAQSQDKLYSTALQTIGAVSKLPVVRVDREAFLRKQFGGSPHLAVILERGPQAVYTAESLRRKADGIIRSSAAKTSLASFATGLPGNPIVMVAAGGADVAQYFGFAINLAQQIAYLFGEDDLFDGGGQLSEAAQVRVIAYLGAMFGAAGAATLISQTSKLAGANLGKKVAAQALTKTAWYPLLKKVGSLIGKQVTKKTVEKTITKAVPVVGGVVSGGLTYVTFRPMGRRLADALVKNLNGDFDDHLELTAEFAATLDVVLAPSAAESGPATSGPDPHPGIFSLNVTQPDVDQGQVRVTREPKRALDLPAEGTTVAVSLRGELLSAPWDPRLGPDQERSGVIRLGKANMARLLGGPSTLLMEKDENGVIVLH